MDQSEKTICITINSMENLSIERLIQADKMLYSSNISQEEFNPLNKMIYEMIKFIEQNTKTK